MLINMYNEVPRVYLDASRDFQFISRLINIVLNSVKHNVDDMYDIPNVKEGSRLAELLAMTLGFKIRRKYNQKQLIAIVNILPEILKNKGTEKAVMLIGNALIQAADRQGKVYCSFDDGILSIILPKDSIDFTLLIDVLPYVLPAGVSYRISRRNQASGSKKTELSQQDVLILSPGKDRDLAVLYSPTVANSEKPTFNNYTLDSSREDNTLNQGLYINTIIPTLETYMYDGTENISTIDEKEEET